MRLLAGLVAVLVLAGCGTMANRAGAPGAPAARLADAPPIQALDDAPPAELQRMLDEELAPLPADFGESSSSGSSSSNGGTTLSFRWGVDVVLSPIGAPHTSTTTTPTPEDIAKFRAELESRQAAIAPGKGSTPRMVARLSFAGAGNAYFVVWNNNDGLLCTDTWATWASGANGGGFGGGPSGPCADLGQSGIHCAALCLASSGGGSSLADETWVLTGTVAADADAIDVTTAAGTTAEYPLTGPLVAGGDRRVFMLELGKTDWRKLVLLRGGRVVDESTLPTMAAASEDCTAEVAPMPPPKPPETPGGQIAATPEMETWQASFETCLRAHGALPPPLVAPLVGSTTP